MDSKIREPLVSVCIPCYNHERFISDCLDSLMDQTYENIELLICDDCSQDASWDVIQKYIPKLEERFVRVVTLKNEVNRGVAGTLNRLLSVSRGVYIKSIASDDFLYPTYTEIMVRQLENDHEIGILFCNGVYVKEKSTYREPLRLTPFFLEPVQIDHDHMEKRLFDHCFIFAPGVILRKDVYNECGIYNEDIEIEDWEYWLRAACSKKFKFAYLDEILVYYRKSENAMTSRIGAGAESRLLKMYRAEKKVIEIYAKKMGKETGARRKIWHIIYGERAAYKFNFKNNLKEIENDYDSFEEWRYLPLKDKIICRTRHFFRFINKFI